MDAILTKRASFRLKHAYPCFANRYSILPPQMMAALGLTFENGFLQVPVSKAIRRSTTRHLNSVYVAESLPILT